MALDIKKLMELCKASLDYTEGPNNDTTFGKWYGLNNQPWCAMSASKMYFDAGGITEVAKRAVRESARSAGAREVYLIEEPVAAAIGAGLQHIFINA